jgi:CheY-like chemotaxis protein
VRLARGGQEGLAAIRARRPGAVVLDLFMPGMDGFTFLEQIRATPETRDVPVIIFTAGDLTEEQHERLSRFTQNMLNKSSFEEEEMLAIIKRTLSRLSLQEGRS